MTDKSELISLPVDSFVLEGFITIPQNSKSLVIFAHGAGSSRHSPRNRFVAKELNKEGLSTLLFDLLTEKEDLIYENRFNIELITDRLIQVTKGIFEQENYKNFKLGYFGSSTGASSALQAAAILNENIAVIVSRGGRSDLAGDYLRRVNGPTLLIAGEFDKFIIEANNNSISQMSCETKLEIIRNAGHLFEGKGQLEQVANLAKDWLIKYLK